MKNIKISIATGLFALMCTCAQAQITANAGFMAGMNYATMSLVNQDDQADPTYLSGTFVSAFVEYVSPVRISLQTELSFIQKGMKVDLGIGSYKNSISYLEIPVLLKYDFIRGEAMDLQLYAGPTFGFHVGHKESIEIAGEKFTDETLFQDDEYKASETGLAIGVSARFAVGRGKLSFDLRSVSGLTNAIEKAGLENARNNGGVIAIGYVFPLQAP